MNKAAIYCRVSTDSQESEGTSLSTQLEACLKYCREKAYDVAYRFSEAYSGLTLDRPKMNELRDLVRAGDIDVVVIYCLDRLSRNATHGVILRDEFDKNHVLLESVTEDIDKTPLGEAITYLRGTFSQIEAEKIKERTIRGKKAKARMGKMSSGGFARLYGYDYIKVSQENGGRRVINENEAKWVRQIYHWLVDDGMSTSAITYKLITLGVPTKCGNHWRRQAVRLILRNPAYMGRTYAFTTDGKKQFSKPQSEWIEIPNVTPPIIESPLFEAARKQLQVNWVKSTRNMKYEYLLRGHLFCKRCGRSYRGKIGGKRPKVVQYYNCGGTSKLEVPFNRCTNRSWRAETIEALVWEQIERVLNNPELIITEIDNQRRDSGRLGVLELELGQVKQQMRILDRDQKQLLQWALKGFPEETVVAENAQINAKRTGLQAQKAELEAQIKAGQEATITLPKLEHVVEMMRVKLATLDFETRKLALDMLNIKVWLDGHDVEITGILPITDDVIVTMQS